MKVYLVWLHYYNGGMYEDSYTYDYVMAVFLSREKAEAYIASYCPNKDLEEDQNPWIEGNPYPKYQSSDDLRHFHRESTCVLGDVEEEYFTISEMEVRQ